MKNWLKIKTDANTDPVMPFISLIGKGSKVHTFWSIKTEPTDMSFAKSLSVRIFP